MSNSHLRAASKFGLSSTAARTILQPKNTDHDIPLVGPNNLRQYIVAVKIAREHRWQEAHTGALEQARLDYDAGLVEMFQGGATGFTIQYVKPRKDIIKRRPYFVMEEEKDAIIY